MNRLRNVLYSSASGMLGISVAAISDCQKKTSPRIRSVGTPAETVRSVELEMKVIAYTNSFTQRENEKMITVRIPGIEIGKITRASAFSLEQPSTSAASSSSSGMVLKKPISSQVANGTVNDGYTSTSDHSWSCKPSFEITRERGRKSSVGGTRYVRKMPTPTFWPQRPASRASE